MKCVRVILFPAVSDTASRVADIMENYNSHTCLKCIRVIIFPVVSETASVVPERVNQFSTASIITPRSKQSQYRGKIVPGPVILQFGECTFILD